MANLMSTRTGLDTRNFAFVNFGQSAIFVLPAEKISVIEKDLHDFLIENFGIFTHFPLPSFCAWLNGKRVIAYNYSCRLYEVSFFGKEKKILLGARLAEIALRIDERCIYFKVGQYPSLIYPKFP